MLLCIPLLPLLRITMTRHLSAGHRPIIYNVCKQRSDDMCQIAYTPGRLKDVLDYLRDTELRIYGCTDFEYTYWKMNGINCIKRPADSGYLFLFRTDSCLDILFRAIWHFTF